MSTDITPRRILFLLPTLRGGGAERVIVTLLRHLDRKRFQLTLAVVDMVDAVYRDDIPPDVELIDLQSRRVRYSLPRIIHLIWKVQPDVVFSTLGHLNLALAMLRPLLPHRTRYLARETSVVSQVIADYRRPRLWAWAYQRFYHRFDLVVCQSRYMRDDLVLHYGFPDSKSVVINNPVDTCRIRRLSEEADTDATDSVRPLGSAERVRLLAVGRLSNEKGFDMLIEALALCQQPALHLTILGEGPLRQDLERLVRDKGVQAQVVFAGFHANPYPYFCQADALVLSSRYEGFPNVVLEALACGTPVISTRAAGGVTEIIDGVEGCALADDVSAESLARVIKRFARGARVPSDVVRPYEVDTIVRRYEEALA